MIMETSTELLEHRTKAGITERVYSVANSDPSAKSLGQPVEKHSFTWQDTIMLLTSLLCFLIGILAVANVRFAAYLGQKNQLILLGLLLSLMAACTQKQAQLLLIALETKFGTSTLQNYDSILRYSMVDSDVNLPLKAAIAFSFVLPLVLSASYKQFVSGTTILPMDPEVLAFGPVGPPGLADGVLALMMNASLPLLVPNVTAYQSEPLLAMPANRSANIGSYGFNIQILSDNMTALLDAPLATELTHLTKALKEDEILEISTFVNATICTINSTSRSPERADPDYWKTLNQSLSNPTVATYGTNLSFAGATGEHDYSFVLMSMWDTGKGETYESEAIGFNLFRSQCLATWQINSVGTITLKNATNCLPAHEFSRPCMGESIPEGFRIEDLEPNDALQTPLTCNSNGATLFAVWPLYDLLWLQPVFPVWIAAVASMAWAEIAFTNGPASWASVTPVNESAWEATRYPILKYQQTIIIEKTVQTLHRNRGALYFVLAIQPILLLAAFVGRMSLFSTPVTSGFGLVSLLAGVSRDSLDVLRGAAFSGKLKKPVEVRISTAYRRDFESNMEYELDSKGRHDSIRKGVVYH